MAWQGGGSQTAVMPASAMASALSASICHHAGLRAWSRMLWHSQLNACDAAVIPYHRRMRCFPTGEPKPARQSSMAARPSADLQAALRGNEVGLNAWVNHVTARCQDGITLCCAGVPRGSREPHPRRDAGSRQASAEQPTCNSTSAPAPAGPRGVPSPLLWALPSAQSQRPLSALLYWLAPTRENRER